MLPSDAQERKDTPIATGVLDYFPDAIAEIARVSKVANEQHNPGEPMHWAKEKSTDEADAAMRHFLERGTLDSDGLRHSAKYAWRALALLQRELDAEQEAERMTVTFTTGRVWSVEAAPSTLVQSHHCGPHCLESDERGRSCAAGVGIPRDETKPEDFDDDIMTEYQADLAKPGPKPMREDCWRCVTVPGCDCRGKVNGHVVCCPPDSNTCEGLCQA